MIGQRAFEHIFAPVDEYNMYTLRNAALCGVLAFAFLIVGVNQLLTLVVYVLVISMICVFAWLHSLAPDVRIQVVTRVRDVFNSFWRKCVDDSFGNTPSGGEACPRAPKNGTTIGRRADESEVSSKRRESAPVDVPNEGCTAGTDETSGIDSKRIDELSEGFTDLFSLRD